MDNYEIIINIIVIGVKLSSFHKVRNKIT